MQHCESCGSELPDWARFCGSCGHPLTAAAARAATDTRAVTDRSTVGTGPLPALSLQDTSTGRIWVDKTRAQRSSNPPTSEDNEQEEEHSNVLVECDRIMPVKGRSMVQETPSASHPSTTHDKSECYSRNPAWGAGIPIYRGTPHTPPHTQLPILSLTAAVGVFLVALAYNAGRAAAPWADTLFWFGLLVLFLPIAGRLFSPGPARRERIALIIVLGTALNLTKFLQYPLYFASYDEFAHWRTAQDIVASGHLFQGNPLLSISPLYPGLEIVTNALSSLTGLSIFSSGTLVIGVARLVLVLALYLFYEHISNSAHVAGIAALLYMANPGFLGTDVMFAYESLALPLAVLVVFVVARRHYAPAGRHTGLTLAIWLGLGAVVITHPLTSYALVAFLCLWTVAYFQQGRGQKGKTGPGRVALLGLVLTIAWLIYTGNIVVSYLTSPFAGAVHQLVQILDGERTIRPLFQDGSGFVTPLWERVTAYTSVALVLLGIPFGLFRIWQHHRASATALALAGAALAYPASQALRLTNTGAEVADRSTEFLFLGIAFVLAIGATEFWLAHAPTWRRSVMTMAVIAVLFMGQTIVGNGPPWARMPGPYLVSADQRSIEPEGIAAAEWAHSYLGSGHRIASDRINALLMATYGGEWVVTASNDKIAVWPLFISPQFRPRMGEILRQDRIQYLVVDRRLSTGLPRVGTYFNKGEPNALHYTTPIDAAALAKFDGMKDVNRLFDSGDIVIYDVGAIASGSSPQSSCAFAPSTTVSPSSAYPHVAKLYTGTIHDLSTGITTNIFLRGIQQQQWNICGYFGEVFVNYLPSGMPGNGPFTGIITADNGIQFIVSDDTEQATFSFNGVIQPDGTITGTYCRTIAGKCSNYGLWNVSPLTGG